MPLPHQVRAYFEPRVGHDFGQVKVHHDAYAAQFARRMHAKAFTYQNHIVFGQKQFLPATRQGKRLIAHELVHVVQQTGRKARSDSTHIMHSSPPDFVQRAAEDWLEASPNPADFSNEELALELYSIGLWLQDHPEAPERQHLLIVLDAFETEATTRADQIGLTDVAEGRTTPLATGLMAGEIPAEPASPPHTERPPIRQQPLSRPHVSQPVPGPPTAAPAPVVSRGASLFGVLGAAVLAFLVVFLYPRESIMSEDEERRLREEFRRRELERELRARPGPEAAPRPVRRPGPDIIPNLPDRPKRPPRLPPVDFYHGTDDTTARTLEAGAYVLAIGGGEFGEGFYTFIEQAPTEYAAAQYTRNRRLPMWAVVEFGIPAVLLIEYGLLEAVRDFLTGVDHVLIFSDRTTNVPVQYPDDLGGIEIDMNWRGFVAENRQLGGNVSWPYDLIIGPLSGRIPGHRHTNQFVFNNYGVGMFNDPQVSRHVVTTGPT